jgi:hypothetical protein
MYCSRCDAIFKLFRGEFGEFVEDDPATGKCFREETFRRLSLSAIFMSLNAVCRLNGISLFRNAAVHSP